MRSAFVRTSSPWPWLLGALVGTVGVACSAILGLDPPPSQTVVGTGGGGGGSDGGPSPVCAALDASLGPNALVEAGAYSAMNSDGGTWDFFDLHSISGAPTSFAGGTFDGQYVYFAPTGNKVLRYNTLDPNGFSSPTAWEFFAVPVPAGMAATPGFSGAGFDGRFVYFVPGAPSGIPASLVERFDTTGIFTDEGSWSWFDTTTMTDPAADAGSGYFGGAVVGHDLYLAPHNNGVPDGRVVHYTGSAWPKSLDGGGGDASEDASELAFADASAWQGFPVTSFNSEAAGFAGVVYDSHALYFVPNYNDLYDGGIHGGNSGVVARYDLGPLAQSTSWSFFDVTEVNGLAYGFTGGSFDGRYVYLVPRLDGIAVRFDTMASGGAMELKYWSSYDVTRAVSPEASGVEFAGSTFDGRFVYYVPTNASFGQVVRYDTLSDFTADCAWSTADLSAAGSSSKPGVYQGAVFDGQYLYLLPAPPNAVVARFLVRTPASMPHLYGGAFHGSFW